MLFLANRVMYESNEAKILFTLSKMTGEGFAAEWGNIKGDEIAETGIFSTWEVSLQEMRHVFDDPNN